jgi:hypothetical protein
MFINRAAICWWPWPAQSFLVSVPVTTHEHIYFLPRELNGRCVLNLATPTIYTIVIESISVTGRFVSEILFRLKIADNRTLEAGHAYGTIGYIFSQYQNLLIMQER